MHKVYILNEFGSYTNVGWPRFYTIYDVVCNRKSLKCEWKSKGQMFIRTVTKQWLKRHFTTQNEGCTEKWVKVCSWICMHKVNTCGYRWTGHLNTQWSKWTKNEMSWYKTVHTSKRPTSKDWWVSLSEYTWTGALHKNYDCTGLKMV